ncbi:MAG: hypothetical protein B6U85_09660 [Desulfurococcales archaeon ex4484_42]|nr:MAG: hypothetical protein B6U85_09660 [Desulfurococcales archaeon ex4484_42]
MVEMTYMRIRELIGEASNVFIIHHWDTDGVSSAAMLLRKLGNERVVDVVTPKIGFYEYSAIPKPDFDVDTIVILDYGVNGDEYEKYYLSLDRHVRLIVIDHHMVFAPKLSDIVYINPLSSGVSHELRYPSTSSIVYEILDMPNDKVMKSLYLLGIIGDIVPLLKNSNKLLHLNYIHDIIKEVNTDIKELIKLSESIDSCYRLLDYTCLKEAVYIGSKDGVEGLLKLKPLINARARAESLINDALNKLHLILNRKNVKLYELTYDAYVTSAIGRKLAELNPKDVIILLHHIPKLNKGFIYVRSISRKLNVLWRKLIAEGIKVGGKEYVLVLEYVGDKPGVSLALMILNIVSKELGVE